MPLEKKKLVDRIEEEHDHLKEEMVSIRELIAADITDATYAEWRINFMWVLRDFYNDLQKHFDLEQEGGFMSDILKVAPQFANVVERLEDEHELMGKQLTAILEMLKPLEAYSPDALQDVFSRVEEFLTLLTDHEAAEGDVIETAYMRDYGGGD